jgi:hypothetical protein
MAINEQQRFPKELITTTIVENSDIRLGIVRRILEVMDRTK